MLTPASELRTPRLERVESRRDTLLWNEHVDPYHYQRCEPLPGAQLRYFARSEDGLLALFGLCVAAWKTAPRDDLIA